MLIRSQNKRLIVNLNNIEKLGIYEYERKIDKKGKEYLVVDGGYGKINPNVFKIETKNACLGEYSTEEKAIKVLDMIEQRYDNLETAKASKIPKHWIPFVFQMPADSEV